MASSASNNWVVFKSSAEEFLFTYSLKLRFSDFFSDLTNWNNVSDERLGIVIKKL
jgi:hypothetical protein